MEKFLEKIIIKSFNFLKKSPKRLFIIFFTPVLILSAINMVDFFFIPKKSVSDQLVTRRKLYRSHKYGRTLVGYHYRTKKGFEFSISDGSILDNKIDIKHTLIFKTVTYVRTIKKEYTEKLSSNLNGIIKYFHFLLLISLIVSITIFISGKQISRNAYLNIIIFNPLLFVVLLYMMVFY